MGFFPEANWFLSWPAFFSPVVLPLPLDQGPKFFLQAWQAGICALNHNEVRGRHAPPLVHGGDRVPHEISLVKAEGFAGSTLG
jgi:hypothetical protein